MKLLLLAGLLFNLANAATPAWVSADFLGALPAGGAPRSIAVDSAGNIVIAGSAESAGTNSFVAKYSPDGQTQLSYLLLPGTVGAVTTDDAGNTYVAGATTSEQFPTTPGAWQRTLGGRGSAFMLKLDRDGKIVYSTLFGGPGNPYATGIAVNRSGEAFVTRLDRGHVARSLSATGTGSHACSHCTVSCTERGAW